MRDFVFATIIIFAAMISSSANAAAFKGYTSSDQPLVLKERIDRFTETNEDFRLLFEHHAAFYTFPKSKLSDDGFRNFLKASIRSKTLLEAKVNPKDAKILDLRSSK